MTTRRQESDAARGRVSAGGYSLRLILAVLLSINTGCALGPDRPFRASADAAAKQAAQTRHFDGIPPKAMLVACSALLQDLGFIIEEADSKLGVLVGSKEHTAEVNESVAESVLKGAATVALVLTLVTLTGALALGGPGEDPTDRQVIRVALSVTPAAGDGADRVAVSLTMTRVVYTQSNKVARSETVDDPKTAQAFFAALAKSVFLESQRP